MLGIAVPLLAGGCGSTPQAPAPQSSGPSATSAASVTTASPVAAFTTPASDCFVPADTVSSIAGIGPLTATSMGVGNPSNPDQWSGACLYGGSGGESASILTALKPTVSGQTAQQYLAQEIANESSFTSPQNVPDLGDVAELSSLGCGNGTCGYAVAAVQVRGDTVAELVVTLTQASPGQNPVISLARTVLTALAPGQ